MDGTGHVPTVGIAANINIVYHLDIFFRKMLVKSRSRPNKLTSKKKLTKSETNSLTSIKKVTLFNILG